MTKKRYFYIFSDFIILNCRTLYKPVSYTHLDVYKRQHEFRADKILVAHFRNFNAQRIHDVLTHGETGRTGSILHVGEGIEYAAEPTGIQIHRIDYSESALSIFFNKVVKRCCVVIADNSSQLAGNIIVIQKVDRLAGGERQIDLLCICLLYTSQDAA